jgi:excisionase family DNA binding protein
MPITTTHSDRRWATITEVAEYLGITIRTVHAMMNDGRLIGYHCGPRFTRLDLNEVDAALVPRSGAE